ncbi:UNVERIFIED_CONTAM: hypothetical protein Sindi_2121400 [Sesamum indicum]
MQLLHDCFAPVAKTMTVRLLLAIATTKGWFLHHLDVNNAFLHGNPDEASRQWNHEFTEKIKALGFIQSKYAYFLFTKGTNSQFVALLFYVDDILVTATIKDYIQEVRRYQDDNVEDLGEAKYFLGLELSRSQQGRVVTHNKYAQDIIKDVGLHEGKSIVTPLFEFFRRTWGSHTGTFQIGQHAKQQGEYKSMTTTVCEIVWVNNLLKDLGVKVLTPVPFFCDNKADIHITENPVFHERTKHVEIDCHAPLPGNAFLHLCSNLGLVAMNASPTCVGAAEVSSSRKTEAGNGNSDSGLLRKKQK